MPEQTNKQVIAYLTSSYARAGDTFIRREVEELRRLGWTVHTFSIRRADSSERVSEEIFREQATTVYILEQGVLSLCGAFLRMFFRYPGRMARAVAYAGNIRWPGLKSALWHLIYLLEASYLAERLIERQVTLLHNHIAMNSATVGVLASTLAGMPFSMTVHGPHEFFAPEHWGLGAKMALSCLTVCISHYGRSQCMLFSPPVAWGKLHVVRCGLDGEFFQETPKPLPSISRMVCVGRLSPEKGQTLLVDVAARLRDEGIEVEIVIVGDGPSREEIADKIQSLDLQDRVRLVGWQGSEQVRRFIDESQVMVLPSFAEGIPVVLMEAMALGRPVIATYVGGIPELVRAGENGWLVPAGSLEDLYSAMREALLSSSKLLTEMGIRGRQKIMEQHSLVKEVEKLNALFCGEICKVSRCPSDLD